MGAIGHLGRAYGALHGAESSRSDMQRIKDCMGWGAECATLIGWYPISWPGTNSSHSTTAPQTVHVSEETRLHLELNQSHILSATCVWPSATGRAHPLSSQRDLRSPCMTAAVPDRCTDLPHDDTCHATQQNNVRGSSVEGVMHTIRLLTRRSPRLAVWLAQKRTGVGTNTASQYTNLAVFFGPLYCLLRVDCSCTFDRISCLLERPRKSVAHIVLPSTQQAHQWEAGATDLITDARSTSIS